MNRARTSRRLLALLAVASFGVCLALFSAPASAAVDCGDTIKRDIKLKSNLNCSASGTDGIEIDKNGIEIDLNGKKLIGPDGSYNGVDGNGYDGWTVKNGTLEGWDYAVYGYYASRTHFNNLAINLGGTNDDYGVYSQYAVDVSMNKVTVDNASYGFYLYGIDGLKLTNSKVTGSDSSSTYGVYDYNTVGKIDGLTARGALYGIYTGGETSGYRILDGNFTNAGAYGVYVSNSTPLYRYRYTLSKNVANNAGSYGFYASYDTKGGGNKATGAGTQDCFNVPCSN